MPVIGQGWLAVLVCASLVGVIIPAFAGLVRVAGWQIQRPGVVQDYALGVWWAVALALLLVLLPIPVRDKPALLLLWAVKCCVTLGFMLFYEWHYGLDAFDYFRAYALPEPPWSDLGVGRSAGNSFIRIFAWYQGHIMPPSYHALKVSSSLLGLIAVYLFYRAGVIFMGREDRRILYVLALYPSVLFWSSIVGKEPFMLLGVAMYTYGVVAWNVRGGVRFLLLATAGIAMSAMIRLWMAPIMLGPLLVFGFRGVKGVVGRIAMLIGVLLAVRWTLTLFAAEFALETVQDLYGRVEGLSRGWEGGSATGVSFEVTGLGSLLAYAPLGAFTALFRPLPGEVMNPFGLLAGIENFVLLLLFVLSIKRLSRERLSDALVQWAIALIVLWSMVYGFASSQNLGAAVRFKLQILPVFLGVLLYLTRPVSTQKEST